MSGRHKRIIYKFDNDTYQQKLDKLYNNQFKLMSDYIDARSHVTIECLKCDHIFDISCITMDKPHVEEKCPNCKVKKREEEIKNIIQGLYDTITVHSVSYIGSEKYNVNYSCNKHNTTYTRLSKGMMYEGYNSSYVCNECQKEHLLEEKIKYVENKFPLKLDNGYILNHIRTDIDNWNIIISCIDQDGYKYSFDTKTLSCIQSYKSDPCRFFKRNPYTYENINLYCKLNNIDLSIDGTGLPVSGYARELLNFVDSEGNVVKTSWNHITRYKIKCKTSDETTRIQNRIYMCKEKAIPIVKNKEKELGRPLLQSDFEGVVTTNTSIGIRVIWRLWGTFSNMIDELGLMKHDYFYKPNNPNYIPHEDIMLIIKDVCEKVKFTGRNIIMYSDFTEHTNLDVTKFRRHCAVDKTTLNDVVKLYDCELQRVGNGMNHRFEDGEFTSSKYEYDFSQFLRDNGFEYGKTYFRNIYYKKLDNEYKGSMNCDYCIDFNGQLVYIELAGILGNKEHQDAYRNNTPLKSKSKEEYRQKLNQKREIFERNCLEYCILLPDDMNEETYNNILKKYLKEVA